MEWFELHLPNMPLLKGKLDSSSIEYLWQRIEEAAEINKDARSHLAGNISESIYLEDKDNYFYENILKDICRTYIDTYKGNMPSARNSFEPFDICRLLLKDFWVNSQRETEFNPTHNHGGVLSFVIWMKIPTHWKEQYELPFSKGSNTPTSSDFQIMYTDVCGNVSGFRLPMSPEMEGEILVFPSTMIHQVYPFYNCKEDRVSISGNLYFDSKVLEEIHEKEYNENFKVR